MPTLDWIGKQAVLNHHRTLPCRLLHCDRDLSAGHPDSGSLLRPARLNRERITFKRIPYEMRVN